MSTESVSPELKLKRFLHYGHEGSLYQSSSNFIVKRCIRDNVTSIEALLAEEKATEVATLIMKAFGDGYSAHPEALVFALAMCAKQNTSIELQEAAHSAVSTVCKEPDHFFLFIKFSHALSNPTSGWGRGFKRAIAQWYEKMEAMELAKCVTKSLGSYGWSHRDIIKLAHVKSDDVAKAAVLHFVIRGLDDAKKHYGDKSEAEQVLNYIEMVRDFKNSKDEKHVARLIEIHSMSPEHLPPNLLKSIEVWGALIPHMSLPQLLQNIKRFALLRFLRGNYRFVSKILDVLSNQAAIAESNLHPAEVLVAICNYENINKPFSWGTEHVNKIKNPPLANPKIIEALRAVMASTFKLLVPTGMRYLVAVDVRSPMVQGKCWHSSNVTPAKAAILMTLCLVHAERQVTVLAFGAGGQMHEVKIDKETTMEEAQEKFQEVQGVAVVDLAQPLEHAKRIKKEVDVFIMLTDTAKPGKLPPGAALQQYRTELRLPNTKMVTCALAAPKLYVACPNDPGMLDIAGFDGHVPRIIEAFSRGAF